MSVRQPQEGVIGLADLVSSWQPAWCNAVPSLYRRGFRVPAKVIEHAMWLYYCFSLSLRSVETIPAARGIVVSYESIRE